MADSPHHIKSRRQSVTGADAQIILGNDEASLLTLWHAKRGELEPEDVSKGLAAQLATTTKELNRLWCRKNAGYVITGRRRVTHPVHHWMAADIDGRIEIIEALFSAHFVPEENPSEEAVAARFLEQLQHDLWVTGSRRTVLSTITGSGRWIGMIVHADPLYQHLLLTAERKFWRCVQSGDPPRLFNIELPRPSIERIRPKEVRSGGTVARHSTAEGDQPLTEPVSPNVGDEVVYIRKPVRERDQHHLRFVSSQPCLICARRPTDAHHLRFAQVTAMGRKVSDRFTVPLCRLHHRDLHDRGNERLWWQDKGIDPLAVATALWRKTHEGEADEQGSIGRV